MLVGDLDGHLWLKHAIGIVCAFPLAFPRGRAAACPFQRCYRGGARKGVFCQSLPAREVRQAVPVKYNTRDPVRASSESSIPRSPMRE